MNTVKQGSLIPDDADQERADKLPPIPQRMLDLLSDGHSHGLQELIDLLGDDQATASNVHPHLNVVRRYLCIRSQGILCEFGPGKCRKGAVTYRMVNYLSPKA